ncbi:MAG: hypothetical protein ACLQGP_36965 [Isosphaeraceae bacterium]
MNILDAIPTGSTAALDTVVWTYEFETNPVFGQVTNVLFRDGFGAGRCSERRVAFFPWENCSCSRSPGAGWISRTGIVRSLRQAPT